MVSDLKNMSAFIKPDEKDYVFRTEVYHRQKSKTGRLSRYGAYNKIKKWGVKYLGFPIHPHMLRHGLAIYLLSQNVPIPVIAARLGHSSMFVTQASYLVITPEIQRELLQDIEMR
jgi:integrase